MFSQLFVAFVCVLTVFGSPDMVVRILSDDGGAPRLLPPPLEVHTYLSSFAPGSEPWLKIMDQLESEVPNLVFRSHWVSPDEVEDGKVVAFPYTKIIDGESEHMYAYPLEYRFMRRWLTDAQNHRYSLFENVSALDASVPESHPVYVHILSSEKPENRLHRLMPEVGFFWTFMNRTKYFNTVILRGLDGRVQQRNNFSEFELFHSLLPPIIPYWMLEDPTANVIYNTLSVRDIDIVYDGPLEPWWNSLALRYPHTAFVHYRSNETNVAQTTSVWFRRRSVIFMIESVGKEVEEWLVGIRLQKTKPWKRPSQFPETPHARIADLTGDSYRHWISENENAIVYLHNGTFTFDLDAHFEPLVDANYSVAQMNVLLNDHESLPLEAVSGMCLQYVSHSLVQMSKCSSFKMPMNDLPKTEL
tara:strand:+ start:15377 stop:16624 length:1248 start_codon:yes stop_codon:yes gene_type:complete